MEQAAQGGFKGVVDYATSIGLQVVPFLGIVAFLFFIWGIARFIKASGSGKDTKDSKNFLTWGVVAMLVLVSIWGLISFLRKEFDFNDAFGIPQVKIKK